MKHVVVSGVGPDKPGIVAALTDVFFRHGCNIVDSTMTRLHQQFATILVLTVPDTVSMETLEGDLKTLEAPWGMVFLVKEAPDGPVDTSEVGPNRFIISVSGWDQTGITYQVSQLLARRGINITDLDAHVLYGEEDPVYLMMLEVDIPDPKTQDQLEEELSMLGESLDVEIQLRPVEAVLL